MAEDLTDLFKGDDAALVESIQAALALNRDGALTPRIPTMATTLLESAAARLASAVSAERPGREAVAWRYRWAENPHRSWVYITPDERAKFNFLKGDAAAKWTLEPLFVHPAPVKADTAGEGWVLAPRDPTEAMLKACGDAWTPTMRQMWPKIVADLYRAMLSAAPAPSEGGR